MESQLLKEEEAYVIIEEIYSHNDEDEDKYTETIVIRKGPSYIPYAPN